MCLAIPTLTLPSSAQLDTARAARAAQAAVLAPPLSAVLAAALPHWQVLQPRAEPVAAAGGGGGGEGAQAFLQRRGAGVLYGGGRC